MVYLPPTRSDDVDWLVIASVIQAIERRFKQLRVNMPTHTPRLTSSTLVRTTSRVVSNVLQFKLLGLVSSRVFPSEYGTWEAFEHHLHEPYNSAPGNVSPPQKSPDGSVTAGFPRPRCHGNY